MAANGTFVDNTNNMQVMTTSTGEAMGNGPEQPEATQTAQATTVFQDKVKQSRLPENTNMYRGL